MTLALIRSELLKTPDISDKLKAEYNKTSVISRNQMTDDTDFIAVFSAMLTFNNLSSVEIESRNVTPINNACRVIKPYVDLSEDFYFI